MKKSNIHFQISRELKIRSVIIIFGLLFTMLVTAESPYPSSGGSIYDCSCLADDGGMWLSIHVADSYTNAFKIAQRVCLSFHQIKDKHSEISLGTPSILKHFTTDDNIGNVVCHSGKKIW